MKRTLIPCSECDATLLAPTAMKSEAVRWAEDAHGWVAVGRGSGAFVCPAHKIECTRCGHHNSTAEEIAVRRRLREEAAQLAKHRRDTMARWRVNK